jgi:hypothetical protein
MYVFHSPESGTPSAPLRHKSLAPRSGFVQQVIIEICISCRTAGYTNRCRFAGLSTQPIGCIVALESGGLKGS